ncbi:HoxN/HupN/NixA family nickel/cobalt transporter [Rhodococcus opacus]|uniref:Nickel/cobalt efflux system n=1 Tax=Rhodococcus opacus TaxID=37919 RepID=A0AAX3Y5P6_RHOOP|nr:MULTISPECIES: HoxN/HupN/NixA family nickel/cobalt transporter [Rhodococcus]MCZ4589790.1 HoxN/HupN/NixA family nickel/cobalt transporter [Rhodococcus opacus]QDQ93055.1 HoxN/HupN/NixA family nickel/cobalt transporter [Rhodococcus sp. WB9]UOT01436.1 HoxN/HupN/NixA family nickel/cobalt transporter [Rhodococcus opacus]WLF44613.1 HoxN/HupN/NixA family nickel/cobalt transporter [Rhodococcus opacus]GLK41367.1 nickel/cobalt efflux system [Rhodococcus wratislaviensis]
MASVAHSFTTRWTSAERSRLAAIVAAIAALHVLGWSLYLWQSENLAAASGFAGAGTLAYILGMRHAFDADHIAAIDDTTRLMLVRGRRPVGVGFFFAMGHSAVVLVLAVLVAFAGANLSDTSLDGIRGVGGTISILVAIGFIALVAALNAVVLTGLTRLWRQYRVGTLRAEQIDLQLLNRGLVNRVLGSRARNLIKSSWHMAPLGFLFGLGLETASEVTLLALSATTAVNGGMSFAAVLTLPLLFAAGMSMMDTADSLLMTRAYSWAYRSPGRRLYYNLATTAMTVVIGLFVASVYLAGALTDHFGVTTGWIGWYGALADHFELFGYVIVGLFVASWLGAVLLWKLHYHKAEAERAPDTTMSAF